MAAKTRKLYCYVDESGQDASSNMFIVSVVVAGDERDAILQLCEQLEQISGKRKDKWGQAKHERRMRYLRYIFADDRFAECLRYAMYHQIRDYDTATIAAIIAAVKWKRLSSEFTTFIYVDGLTKTKQHEYGARLRHLGLPVRRTKGISRDESNALTRLADAVAGFVRDAQEGKSEEIKTLYQKAKRDGMLIEVLP